MDIIVDTREQQPWTFEGLPGIVTRRGKLDTGDYSVSGFEHRITIERKSIEDWTGTILRERARFYRELNRMRAYDFRCVIIEASVRDIEEKRYKSAVGPKAVFGFVAEITVSQSIPVYLGGTRAECQLLAAHLLRAASNRLSGAAKRSESYQAWAEGQKAEDVAKGSTSGGD